MTFSRSFQGDGRHCSGAADEECGDHLGSPHTGQMRRVGFVSGRAGPDVGSGVRRQARPILRIVCAVLCLLAMLSAVPPAPASASTGSQSWSGQAQDSEAPDPGQGWFFGPALSGTGDDPAG
jgi:hypothetical protein